MAQYPPAPLVFVRGVVVRGLFEVLCGLLVLEIDSPEPEVLDIGEVIGTLTEFANAC